MSRLRSRTLFAISFLLLFELLHSSSLVAEPRSAPTKSSAARPDYALALAAGDHFLQAWQAGEIETGLALLTGRAKDKTTRDALDRLFSSSAPAAYEIERGKFLRRGRYKFPIVLLGASPKKPRRHFSNIVVRNTGNNDCAIDKLP